MHGLGNDFMIVEKVTQNLPNLNFTPELVRKLADRHRGVGFDQLLVVEKSTNPLSVDFGYRIFNADGSEVNQCGNGARSSQHFMSYSSLNKPKIQIDWLALRLLSDRRLSDQLFSDPTYPNFNNNTDQGIKAIPTKA